jgi:hypothetical protein
VSFLAVSVFERGQHFFKNSNHLHVAFCLAALQQTNHSFGSMLLLLLFGVALLVSSTSANDGWEFQGGRKRRLTHGRNTVANDQATLPELVVTRDEAPPAPKITSASSLRHSGDSHSNTLLLPNTYSVLNFERNQDEEEAGGQQQTESSWWGR